MTKDKRFFPNNTDDHRFKRSWIFKDNKENLRECPDCGLMSLKGMPGGRDSTCKNCGYKDPCCYD